MAEAWPNERVRHELEAFLEGAVEWPSYREFQRRGRKGLRDMVTRLGGARRWADRLGVAYVEHKPGYASRWTEDRVRAELREFLDGRREWPTRLEFEQAGHKTLRDAVGRLGGRERWAREFGLPLRDLRTGSKRAWTEARIELELLTFLDGDNEWPTRRAFEQADRGDLLAAVYRGEGVKHWARRVGVTRRPFPAPPGPRIWSDERIRAELTRFCDGRTTWPTQREFVRAGKAQLYQAASRRGGVDRWASVLDLARGRRV